MLAAYTEEMKEENDKLIRQMKTLGENMPTTKEETSFSVEHEKENDSGLLHDELDLPPEMESVENVETAAKGTYTSAVEEGEDHPEKSLEAKALSLADEGLKQEEIAKKLGRGKGEIELLLRLSKTNGNQSKH